MQYFAKSWLIVKLHAAEGLTKSMRVLFLRKFLCLIIAM